MRNRYVSFLALLGLLIGFQPLHAQTFFTANLTPAQAGTNVEAASGTAALALTDEGLRFIVTVDSLSGPITNAHFHEGAAGVDGGVVHGIMDDFDGNTATGVWADITEEQIASLMMGEYYLNVHTEENSDGEIRGQVRPTSGTALSAYLTAAQAGTQETSEGTGTAAVQITDDGVLYLVTVTELTGPITNAHFHEGAAGVGGGVVHGIFDNFDGNTAFGVWPATEGQIDSLLLGQYYLNIHTDMHGGGEIRGQVLVSSGWGFSASLDAEQVSDEVTSDGMGTASLTLTPSGLVYRLTVDGLTGPITNAHFHQGAAGMDGGPVRTILDEFDGNTAMGVWRASDDEPLTPELITDLLQEGLYLNIHTEEYPGGEIRGQVLPDEGASLTAALTAPPAGTQEDSDGTGTAAIQITDDGVAYRVTVEGLTSAITMAHFHEGTLGVGGGVVQGIEFDGTTSTGVWDASDEQIANLLMGEYYLNVHTEEHGGGEIRGQVVPSSGSGMRAHLTAAQAGTDVEGAAGTATLTATPAGLVYRVTVDGLTGDITNAHFHSGALGVGGGVVHGIFDNFDGNTAFGVWPATEGQIDSLLLGQYYLNIHTAANTAGEIRGQVELAEGIGAAVLMSPDQETEEVTSDGLGAASLTLTDAGVVFSLTASGLTGPITMAHFHQGAAGISGGPVRTITEDFTRSTAMGVWRASDDEPLTPELTSSLILGELYLNVHTEEYPGGEIRGQIRPQEIVITSVTPDGGEVPAQFTLQQNYPNPFNPSTTIAFDLPQPTQVSLAVYDVLGRRVATLVDETMAAGAYTVTFNASALPSGVYFYRLQADGLQQTRSMLLMK